MKFSASDPYPLCQLNEYSYSEAKTHSAEVDQWLGLRIDETEMSLDVNNLELSIRRWYGLAPQTLLTPYIEIRLMLELCRPMDGQCVVDLGCAYGRMAHVLHRHYPGVKFIGYEIEPARVREGQRVLETLGNSFLKIVEQDLTAKDFILPEADFYFIYDYGAAANIGKTLDDLKRIAKKRKIQVIARGRGTRFQIHRDHAWLAEVHPPLHTVNFSIYRSA